MQNIIIQLSIVCLSISPPLFGESSSQIYQTDKGIYKTDTSIYKQGPCSKMKCDTLEYLLENNTSKGDANEKVQAIYV